MKILFVTPSYWPAFYWGGPIYSTHGLCNALAKISHNKLRILTTDSAGPKLSDKLEVTSFPILFSDSYAVYYYRRTHGSDIAPKMFANMLYMVKWAEVVHLTGVYSPPTIPTLLACRLLGRPVVLSPLGSLQRWDGCKRKRTKWTWEKVCNLLLRPGRTNLHVTSRKEAEACVARMPRARVALIPNGVEIPATDFDRVWRPNGKLRVLYLGRLHPIKGVENLLESLAMPDLIHASLTLCGEGDPKYQTAHAIVPGLVIYVGAIIWFENVKVLAMARHIHALLFAARLAQLFFFLLAIYTLAKTLGLFGAGLATGIGGTVLAYAASHRLRALERGPTIDSTAI